tara:strand:+ start:1346 stop:1744 length:399 start_codon:yes stop_codon:yes gene_type:complete
MAFCELIGRPPAVSKRTGLSTNNDPDNEFAQEIFAQGKLRAVCDHRYIKVMAPLRGGEYAELLRLDAGGMPDPEITSGTVTRLEQWVCTMEGDGVRIDCYDAMDFYCKIPAALIAQARRAAANEDTNSTGFQ